LITTDLNGLGLTVANIACHVQFQGAAKICRGALILMTFSNALAIYISRSGFRLGDRLWNGVSYSERRRLITTVRARG
jgi:hypothetical protein